MNILLYTLNYFPEVTGIGVYSTGFAEELTRNGHTVEVVTTYPYYPEWKRRKGYPPKIYFTETVNGVGVHRCLSYVPSNPSTMRRIIQELSFSATSLLRLLSFGPRDLLICISPPFSSMVVSSVISIIRRIPLHIHIQDLQPDAAVELGMIKNRLLIAVLRRLERLAYKTAAIASGIGEGMIQRIKERGVSDAKLLLFPNWISIPDSISDSSPTAGSFRSEYRVEDKFVVVYAGSLGEKQGLEVLVEATAIAEANDDRMSFFIIGGGSHRHRLETHARNRTVRNLIFLGVQPRHQFQTQQSSHGYGV